MEVCLIIQCALCMEKNFRNSPTWMCEPQDAAVLQDPRAVSRGRATGVLWEPRVVSCGHATGALSYKPQGPSHSSPELRVMAAVQEPRATVVPQEPLSRSSPAGAPSHGRPKPRAMAVPWET